jgi:large subunit ribosomal protein L32e
MGIKPKTHKKIVKKRIAKFLRYEYEDYPGRLKATWRRPHGIDNPIRRRFKGQRPCAKIGYGSDRKTRHLLPSGFKKFQVRNEKELDILLTNSSTYAAEIAGNISARKKATIVRRAAELGVRVLNPRGKVRTEEKKPETK